MPAIVDIGVRLSGAADASKQLAAVGRAAKDAARAAETTGTSGSLSMRREFMAGQRLQGTLTSMVGVQSPISGIVDGFERIGFMAEQSGMSVGSFLAKVGPGAAATGAAIVGVTAAWSSWNTQLAKHNKLLEEGGLETQNFVENLLQLTGIGAKLKGSFFGDVLKDNFDVNLTPTADPAKMAQVIMRESVKERDVQQQLAAWVEKNPSASIAAQQDRLKLIIDEVEQKQTIFNLEKEIKSLQAMPDTAASKRILALQNEVEQRKKAIEFVQKSQEARSSFFAGMATGNARLPSGDTWGSQGYVRAMNEIQSRDTQQDMAARHLQSSEESKLTLQQILEYFKRGFTPQQVSAFSMDS